MCSSVKRSHRRVANKPNKSGLLVSMSPATRARFTATANAADSKKTLSQAQQNSAKSLSSTHCEQATTTTRPQTHSFVAAWLISWLQLLNRWFI